MSGCAILLILLVYTIALRIVDTFLDVICHSQTCFAAFALRLAPKTGRPTAEGAGNFSDAAHLSASSADLAAVRGLRTPCRDGVKEKDLEKRSHPEENRINQV